MSPSPSCHHIHSTGKRCGSPSLRGEQFCFYHHPTRRPPVRTRPTQPRLDIPAIVDPESLQIALSEVLRRLADNTLNTQRARLFLAALQMAKANLSPYLASSVPNQPGSSPQSFLDLSALLSAAGFQPTISVPEH